MGLRGGNLRKAAYVNSSLGTRVGIDKICRDCELKISGILFTMNLRVMDILEFDVILRMDWLTTHRVIIDCEHRRVTACTQGDTCVTFQGDNHDVFSQTVYVSRWHKQLMGWLASLTLEDKVRQDLDLPRIVHEYEDVFMDKLPGLPP